MAPPMHALTRPRHLALSLLVAFVVSGIGVTVASGGPAAEPSAASTPVAFSTPAPMVGDRVEYQGTGLLPATERIEIKAQETFRNATHTMEGIVVLHDFANATHILDPISLRPVAQVGDDPWTLHLATWAGMELPTDETYSTRLHRAYFGGVPLLPCGLFHPWMDWPAHGPSRTPPCRLDPDGSLRWELISVEVSAGPAQAWIALVRDDTVAMRMVLQEDIPFPVRSEVLAPDGTVQETQTLTGFTRGRTDLVREAPVRGPLPEAELVESTPWLLDDSGVSMPLRLSAAYRAATEDPVVADFLARQPTSLLYEAALVSTERARSAQQVWTLAFSDGRQVLDVEVAQRQWRLPVVRDEVTVSASQRAYDLPLPLPRQLPGLAPSLESLRAAWEEYDGSMETYGFSVRCVDQECGEPAIEIHVGQNGVEYGLRDDLARSPGRHQAEALIFDQRGTAIGFSSTGAARNLVPPGPAEVAAAATLPERVPAPLASPAAVAGAASMALLAALLYFLHPLLKSGPLALFTRIRRDEILDHEGRSKIHEAIVAEPGIHYRALRESLGMANGTLQHHLQKLVEGGLVVVVKGPRHSCYFVKGAVDRRRMLAAPLLKSTGARRVLDAVRAHPGAGTKEIARHVALSPSTVHYHLQRLADAEMVTRRMRGARAAWTA